ncbi:hypothetical protein LPE509_00547 [Legionella pneumophila subsp. pneumophila LPE509]|nr:hypothetical protein LPE509_00547 [Legionella pneumophila subsp. pneumophila LPE509]
MTVFKKFAFFIKAKVSFFVLFLSIQSVIISDIEFKLPP